MFNRKCLKLPRTGFAKRRFSICFFLVANGPSPTPGLTSSSPRHAIYLLLSVQTDIGTCASSCRSHVRKKRVPEGQDDRAEKQAHDSRAEKAADGAHKDDQCGNVDTAPQRSGFRMLSIGAIRMAQARKATATVVSTVEEIDRHWDQHDHDAELNHAREQTNQSEGPAAGTPAARNPTPARRAWITATPRMPLATLRTVFSATSARLNPRSPARRRCATARVTRAAAFSNETGKLRR